MGISSEGAHAGAMCRVPEGSILMLRGSHAREPSAAGSWTRKVVQEGG